MMDQFPDQDAANEKFLHDLIENSRKNDGARKHHVVPNSYIRRWAGPSGQVQVADMETKKTFSTSPGNAARITDYYRVESPDLDPDVIPPAMVENLLSIIEGMAVPAFDKLLAVGIEGIDPSDRTAIATFLGFQAVRGQQMRNLIKDAVREVTRLTHSADMPVKAVKALLESSGLQFSGEALEEFRKFHEELRDGTIVLQPQDAALIGMGLPAAVAIAEALNVKNWFLVRTKPILLTSDEPVVSIAGPGHDRTKRSGMGTAKIVIFPVAPDALLAISDGTGPGRIASLGHIDLAEINREVAANASRWVIDRQGRKTALAFDIPPRPASVANFKEHAVEQGRLIHGTWLNRWASSESPPDWPVRKWFL